MNTLTPSATDPNLVRAQTILRLQNQIRNGARWFWWIAGLSLINSLIARAGGSLNFVIGLGFTQLIDGFAQGLTQAVPQFSTVTTIIAILADLLVAGLFVLFGYFGQRSAKWSFIGGIILYFLDMLLFIAFTEWLSVGFHIFALVFIIQGFRAIDQLKRSMQMPVGIVSV